MLKNSSLYAIAIYARSAASFLMLPIYTQFLTPKDYGLIEILSMIIDVVALIIGLRLAPSIIRLFQEKHDRSAIVTTAYLMGIISSAIGMGILYFSATSLSIKLLGTADYTLMLQIFVLSLFSMILSEVFFAILRASEKAKNYLIFSMIKLTLQISLNIYFIAILKLGVIGFIYSSVLTGLTLILLQAFYIIKNYQFKPNLNIAKFIVSFSLPIALGAGIEFIIAYSDRFFIHHYLDLSAVGVYALAYKFGFLVLLVSWSPLSMAWEPLAYRAVKEQRSNSFFNDHFYLIFACVCTVMLGIGLFSPMVISIMAHESFHIASMFIPLITLAYLIQAYGDFFKLGYMYANKTKYQLYATIIGAIGALLSYYFLIPSLGIWGAALGTLIALSIKSIAQTFFAKQFFPLIIKTLPMQMVITITFLVSQTYSYYLFELSLINTIIAIASFIVVSLFIWLIVISNLSEEGKQKLQLFKSQIKARIGVT
ncbi:oligosaccharide flippase family protein [Pleionea mediterranea]|uniref:O-antigen/teichoic acid export membrane protein n=1 Tax=Pleionea mediterranea TaxID=523701 RepID=A0A316G004_9GAMM|nr:oligosaccharide flippase family protein [Pleionea mediterranea]PWK53715.1 O-antigen/teichoic acid export membrane protein [Pleionea mediterranea]